MPNRDRRGSDAWIYSSFTSTSICGSRCPGITVDANDLYVGILSDFVDDDFLEGGPDIAFRMETQ